MNRLEILSAAKERAYSAVDGNAALSQSTLALWREKGLSNDEITLRLALDFITGAAQEIRDEQ